MIVKNTIFNFLGLALPLIVGVITIPILIESLGIVRFGLLTLVWTMVSYASLFDFGLGKALTLEIAVLRSQGDFCRMPGVIGTSYLLMTIIGIVLSMCILYFAKDAVALLKDIDNYQESINSLYLMAMAVPFLSLIHI